MRSSQVRETLRKLGIVANRVDRRPQNPVFPRLGVLRHEEHIALLLSPDFVHKLGKTVALVRLTLAFGSTPCLSPPEIKSMFHFSASRRTVRFSPSGADRSIPAHADSCRSFAGTHSPGTCAALAHQVQVPHGVVENNQHVGLVVESNQEFVSRASLGWVVKSSSVAIHSAARALGRLCMPRWKDLGSIGRRPFHGNRNLPCAGDRPQQHGCLDVVVVRKGKPWAPGQVFRSAGSPGQRPAWESSAASSNWRHSSPAYRAFPTTVAPVEQTADVSLGTDGLGSPGKSSVSLD